MANENIFLADKEKIAVLQKALRIAAQYARDNLPSKLPKDMNYVQCIVDGQSDPMGERFLNYWVMKALF